LPPASAGFLLGILFESEDGGNMFLQNLGLSVNYSITTQKAVLLKYTFLYVDVTDAGHYSVLQGRGNVGVGIQFSEINRQVIHTNDDKCLEIDSSTGAWLHNEEEGQKRTLNDEKARKLQKYRDAKRNRYRQMSGEEKERFLQKKRDAARDRYWRMSGEERAKILQKKRGANRNRYRQKAGEEVVMFLESN
jgi:hypothetical protein